MKKKTIDEIARQCGVSRGTVDRVVHRRPHVRPGVRQLVEEALRESGYVPNKKVKNRFVPQITIAILLPKWSDIYFSQQTYAGINEAEHSINDPYLRIITKELRSRSQEAYISAIDALVLEGVHGIILNGAQSPVMEMKINELSARGIAVVTYDDDVPLSKRVCFIGQNIYRSGAIAAGLMARFMRPNDEVLIVTGTMEFESSKGRVDGFVEQLKAQGFPSDCYYIAECHEQFDLTSKAVTHMLRTHPNLKYIYMANESIAGCVNGVRKAQRPVPVRIICNDLTPSAKKYLQLRQVDFIIGQTFTQKAYKAIVTLYRVLRHGIYPERQKLYTDIFILSQELL